MQRRSPSRAAAGAAGGSACAAPRSSRPGPRPARRRDRHPRVRRWSAACLRSPRSPMPTVTSRCCAPSCRSRWIRRRSSSAASAIRARDRSSWSSWRLSSTLSRATWSASRPCSTRWRTRDWRAGSPVSRYCTTASGTPSRSTRTAARLGSSSAAGRGGRRTHQTPAERATAAVAGHAAPPGGRPGSGRAARCPIAGPRGRRRPAAGRHGRPGRSACPAPAARLAGQAGRPLPLPGSRRPPARLTSARRRYPGRR